MADEDDPFASVSGQPAYARPALRAGLRLGAVSGTGTDARLEVVDPKSGATYAFTGPEIFLIRATNGQTDLADLHEQQLVELDAPLNAAQVLAFFRRLKILGLLADDGAVAEPSAVQDRASRLAEARKAAKPIARPVLNVVEPAPNRRREGMKSLVAHRAQVAVRVAQEERDATGIAMDPVILPSVDEVPESAMPAPVHPEPVALAPPTAKVAATARRREVIGKAISQKRAEAMAKPAEVIVEPVADAVPVPVEAEVDLSAPNKRPRRKQMTRPIPPAPPEFSERIEDDVPAPTVVLAGADFAEVAKPDAFDTITATLSTEPKDPYALAGGDMDALNDEFGAQMMPAFPPAEAEGRFAGRFGGGMGGGGFGGGGAFAGAMGGGGGGFGGGLGGGGMGGGGPNAERIMAMLAARRAGGGGARGEEPGPAHGEKRPMGVSLINPTLVLRLLYILFFPLRYLAWLTIPAVIFAGMTVVQNWEAFAGEFLLFQASASIVIRVLASLFTVNLVARLVQGATILAHGGTVKTMGIVLDFGFLPRFFVDISSIPNLSRRGQLWAWGSPILTRFWLFAVGTVLWAVTRNSGTWFSHYAVIVGQFAMLMAVRSAMPVFPGDGQRFLATFFNDARLLSKSLLALRHVLLGRKLPAAIPPSDIVPLAAFGGAVVLSSVGVFLALTVIIATQLETSLGGFGVTIFLALAGLSLFYFMVLNTAIRRRVEAMGGGGMREGLARDLMAGQTDAELGEKPKSGSATGAGRVFWTVLLVAVLAVAFLPYTYDSGGAVEVLPAARAQAVARTDGEILEVTVHEGEIVQQDQVLARVSNWDQDNAVKATAAQLAGAQAQLNKLRAGPKPEEIELAVKQVDNARSSLDLSTVELARAQTLLSTGTITQKTFDETNSDYQQDLANLAVSEARLDLARSGATQEEIAIAQSDVDRLKIELAFRQDELERTAIRAPMDGRVVTPNLDLLRGRFLRTGETLIEIERVEVIKASIAVPEADIGLIKVGATVRLKAWGDSDREITGVVESVGSAAEEQTTGSVVRVLASFDNSDGLLRSNMTGYAKIEGGEMTVWRAYLRSLTRFFQIEVWSWIP